MYIANAVLYAHQFGSKRVIIFVIRMYLTDMYPVLRVLYTCGHKLWLAGQPGQPGLISCNLFKKYMRPTDGILRKNRQYVSVITWYLSYLIAGNNNKNALFIVVERTPHDRVTRTWPLPCPKIPRAAYL